MKLLQTTYITKTTIRREKSFKTDQEFQRLTSYSRVWQVCTVYFLRSTVKYRARAREYNIQVAEFSLREVRVSRPSSSQLIHLRDALRKHDYSRVLYMFASFIIYFSWYIFFFGGAGETKILEATLREREIKKFFFPSNSRAQFNERLMSGSPRVRSPLRLAARGND